MSTVSGGREAIAMTRYTDRTTRHAFCDGTTQYHTRYAVTSIVGH